MTAGEKQAGEGRRGGDPLRRATMAALGLYLAPVALVVLLIGVLGLLCCAAVRLVAGAPVRAGAGRSRAHGPARAVGAPHVREASRRRSTSR